MSKYKIMHGRVSRISDKSCSFTQMTNLSIQRSLNGYDKKVIDLEKEVQELREFKEFTNMMIRRTLNHTCSDYEARMAIDEKLTGEQT